MLELKHRYNYILPPNETIYLQELKLINPSDKAWPDTTRLELAESRTDLHMENLIRIGSVPAEAQVKITIRIDVQRSSLQKHAFAYQLCHGVNISHKIGLPIKMAFRVQ